jgi:hypothetical protein
MTHEDKRKHFIAHARKGMKMQVVDACKGVASYATVIKALNSSSKYKSKKEQQVIDTAFELLRHEYGNEGI